MTSTHLLDEYPLIVLPTLACAVGLNEAIALQQINYWVTNPKIGKTYDGLRWVRNSLEEWQRDNFPFWSLSTLKRVMASLDDRHLIFKSIALNDNPYDKTLWYTLNKPTILAIVSEYQNELIERTNLRLSTSAQNETLEGINVIPSPTDNTSDTTDNTPRKRKRDLIFDVIASEYLGLNLDDKPTVQLASGQIVKIKAALLKADPSLTADELAVAATYFRSQFPGLDMPQGSDTIGKAIVRYRNRPSAHTPAVEATSIPDSDDPDYEYPSMDSFAGRGSV